MLDYFKLWLCCRATKLDWQLWITHVVDLVQKLLVNYLVPTSSDIIRNVFSVSFPASQLAGVLDNMFEGKRNWIPSRYVPNRVYNKVSNIIVGGWLVYCVPITYQSDYNSKIIQYMVYFIHVKDSKDKQNFSTFYFLTPRQL